MTDPTLDRDHQLNITHGDASYAEDLRRAAASLDAEVEPYTLSVGVISECGSSRCGYCDNWRSSSHQPMAADLLYAILDDAQALGVRQVLFSGGEPLFHPDIFSIMQRARDRELDVLLITNGLLIDAETIERLEHLECKKIGISCDSLQDKRYRRIRGTARAPLTRALQLLAARVAAQPDAFTISLCMTLHRENYDEILPILAFAEDSGFAAQYQPYQRSAYGPTLADARFWPDDDQIARISADLDAVIEAKRQGRPIANRLEYLEAIPSYFRDGVFWPLACYAPYAQITVDEHAGLRPCWPMPAVGTVTTDRPLRTLWRSPEMAAVRQTVNELKCPGCLYSCHLSKSYIPFKPTTVVGKTAPPDR
jgi:MoaA/NifB/PqqE/SkfB family radical SAM enzyme